MPEHITCAWCHNVVEPEQATLVNEQHVCKHCAEAVQAFIKELQEGKKCPRCHEPIERKKQIGMSIYAHPCGCRLGTGRLPRSQQH